MISQKQTISPHFQGASVGPNDALSSLHETLFIPYESTYFDHIARDIVLQHFRRLHVSLTVFLEDDS